MPERFCAYTAGELLLPRYRSYEVALLDAAQFSVGVVDWLVAPLLGDVSVTCPGGLGLIVSEYILLALSKAVSVTVMVTLNGLPFAVVGIPESTPVLVFKLSPAGNPVTEYV